MSKKKIRKIGNKLFIVELVNGKEYLKELGDADKDNEVDLNDDAEGDADADADEDADADADGADDDAGEEEAKGLSSSTRKMIEGTAKKLGKELLAGMKGSNSKEFADLKKQVDGLMESQYGSDSKLKSILNGKAVDSKELTKEEKIVGFYHALVSGNKMALKALSEGTDADGGYLFPNEFSNELVKELPAINVMRNEVRVITMRRDKMDITKLLSGPKTAWTAEKAAISTTTAMFGQVTLTAFKLASIIYASDELVDDSDIFSVVQLIIEQFSEAIATEEEASIWNGNGTTRPQGLTQVTVAGATGSGNIVNDVNRLFYSVPARYRAGAKFFCNSTTMGNLDGVKDTTGRPIIQPALGDSTAFRLKGKEVVISEQVPDNQLFFGDMKRAYWFGDRQKMSVKLSQDTETAFTHGETAIRVIHRVGGLVVFPQAVRKLTAIV